MRSGDSACDHRRQRRRLRLGEIFAVRGVLPDMRHRRAVRAERADRLPALRVEDNRLRRAQLPRRDEQFERQPVRCALHNVRPDPNPLICHH